MKSSVFKFLIFSYIFFGISSVSIAQKTIMSYRIYFNTDIYSLTNDQQSSINSFLNELKEYKAYNIRILGFADYRGSDKYNKELSQRRSHSVSSYVNNEFSIFIHRLERRGEGELPQKANIPLKEQRTVTIEVFQYEPKTLIDLEKGNVGPMDEIVLENLNFKPGRHFLLLESVPILQKLEKILQRLDLITIEIAGHVCCVGDFTKDGFDHDTRTDMLSKNRAKNIYEYLVRAGIDSTRMIHKGYGFSTPLVYPEESAEDKDLNRRVEIRIISK